MKIQVASFSGIVPRSGPTQLENENAQVAVNCDLYAGELRPQLRPLMDGRIFNEPGPVRSIFKYRGRWLRWPEAADIARSPIAGDEADRVYITRVGHAPAMFFKDSLGQDEDGNAVVELRPLGIPWPEAAPDVDHSGGTGADESRVYVYTFVSDLGEEGPPSGPSSVVDGKIDGTWTVTTATEPPDGYEHVIKKRIYRSLTGDTGAALQFVAELDIDAGPFVDNVPGTALGELLPSKEWTPPPAGLLGLTALPGGFVAGFTGNEVWFSEPWQPHAWPEAYSISFDAQVVALGAYANTLVVATNARPYIVNVFAPSSASVTRGEEFAPCIAARGLVETTNGVVYPAADGLVLIGPNGYTRVTGDLFSRREWRTIEPETIFGAYENGRYLLFYKPLQEQERAYLFDFSERRARLVESSLTGTSATVVAEEKQIAFGHHEGDDYVVSLVGESLYPETFTWKSKRFVFSEPVNPASVRILADYDSVWTLEEYLDELLAGAGADALIGGVVNESRVGAEIFHGDALCDAISTYPEPGAVTFRLHADGEVVHEVSVDSPEPRMLPAGYLAREFELEIVSNVAVQAVTVATSTQELAT